MEEEEYTSRIIHYFSTGLLTLPDGSTLRSYLADKLNCDPMRITKKYAGASCLGRRVYHFRDRVHPTIAEIQVAKAELDHLEQRFRLRIEGGQLSTCAPLVATSLSAEQATANAMMLTNPLQAQNMLQSLLLSLGAAQNGNNALLIGAPQSAPTPIVESSFKLVSPLPISSAAGAPAAAQSGANPALPPGLAQLLLPNASCANFGMQ